jgi:DNA repair protein RecO
VPRPQPYRTPALVLRAIPFGETSQVVHCLTPGHGLVAALAKGAFRPGPEFQGGLALASAGEATLVGRRPGELEVLRRFRVTEDLRGLVRDLDRVHAACYVIELLRAWARPGLPNPALFGAALAGLRALASTRSPHVAAWTAWFEARALDATGHRPRLEACAACDGAVRGAVLFSPAAGGVVHPSCNPGGPTRRLAAGHREGVLHLYTARLPDLKRRLPAPEIVRAVRAVHDLFVPWVLERRPAALAAVPGRASASRPRPSAAGP